MFINYYFPELKKKTNCFHVSELVDVFGHKSNVSIVMDFMDTDLEVIIKDPTIILSPANIKSYILQTLQVMWSRKLLISVAEPETVWRSGWDENDKIQYSERYLYSLPSFQYLLIKGKLKTKP